MRSRLRWLAPVLILLCQGGLALASVEDDPWSEFRFLMGEWTAAGSPAQGTGGFAFATELEGKILVRRNRAELPAAAGRPAGKHEDLMVLYREPGGKQVKAMYFDNEGHVIPYAVSAAPDKRSLVFLSDVQASSPRYRLTYIPDEGQSVTIQFEIAPPGKPDEFKLYLQGSARRKEGSKPEKK